VVIDHDTIAPTEVLRETPQTMGLGRIENHQKVGRPERIVRGRVSGVEDRQVTECEL